ncbi:YciI-like protein [Chelativorans sp. Marseille-P2723]|uniref:YciI-like protein n=1 Tax=Chelativorans sp. Marseille-P2723 TaxID=2709133 RepID=UPI00156EDE07|nr:YciI-like protein [Chelativorans sp. Marseille-P2723]
MIFVITCRDKPGHLQVRMDTRPEHLAHLEKLDAEGKLVFAGPFLDDEGKPCGSMVAVRAAAKADAEAMANADPYALAGLFESIKVRPWNWVFNRPESE